METDDRPQGTTRAGAIVLVGLAALVSAEPAAAGMPSITLTDVARARLDAISFFAMGLLLAAGAFRWLWNSLVRDVPWLPQLSYRRALGWTVLWGLLFLIVLTMISGARELLTPGAWEKVGFTYRVKESATAPAPGVSKEDRIRGLETLRLVLWSHAARHEGRLPSSKEEAEFAAEFWRQPGHPAIEYIYRGGLEIGKEARPLAIEYDLYGDGQWALYSDGAVRPFPGVEPVSAAAPAATPASQPREARGEQP
ncbi:hypothetical protein [Planctomyces sp. SH-PL14]|uniref:hypothetical protein n=1 Tax=Planctomyces sp. SH-PL14 TaxID=1632864 RepID=UPI00078B7800|nr:hypothetical protein [Planctomyces sp. SH-PL14]AMV21435.1 hypothetical protein VT03_26265 [Planctomyces sp. SH-PL14]